MQRVAGGEGTTVRRDGPAIDPATVSLRRQIAQVAADGIFGQVEPLREGPGDHPPVAGKLVEDQGLALVGQHRDFPRAAIACFARFCKFCRK